VHPSVVGLVIPAGYSFNLDGTSIYLTLAAVYIAQATDTPFDITQQLGLLAVLLLTSKGAAAVTGGGFITLAASLKAVGHVPVTGLQLIFGIDKMMSEARAITNLIGNGVAAIVVGKWCGAVDEARLQAMLGSGSTGGGDGGAPRVDAADLPAGDNLPSQLRTRAGGRLNR
jgi:aerobic C4-dicarboxylate transport protein